MYVFSDLALARMRASGSFTGYFRAVFLTRAPASIPSNAPPAIANLLNGLGYQEITGSATPRPQVQSSQTSATAGTPPVTTYSVLLGSDINLPADIPATYIAAMAIIFDGTLDGVVNPWLLITDESFGQIVNPGSTLATVAQSPRVLWRWSLRGANVDITWPGLVRSPGEIAWEPPRTQHVYLFPQRINYVPNPSFEDLGLFGWRAKVGLTRQIGGVDSPNKAYGRVAGTRLESLPVLLTGQFFCASAYVRAVSATWVKFGLCNWDTGWLPSSDSLSDQMPVTNTWTRHSFVELVPDNMAGSGFLVVSDGSFDIDLVLLEGSADVKDYFDGDSQTGIIGDFSWQGITHKTLSFWYNNRYLVGARLFGTYTNGAIAKQGLVYVWVPAGTSIYTHWDRTSIYDTGAPLVDFPSRIIP